MSELITRINAINYAIPMIPATPALFHYCISNKTFAAGENDSVIIKTCTESRTYSISITFNWKSALPSNVYRIFRAKGSSGSDVFNAWYNSGGGYRKWCNGQSNSNFVSGSTFQVTCDDIIQIVFNTDKVACTLELFDIWIW